MHLVVPQGLAARTGGFAYDRRLVDGLRDRGWSVTVHELGPDFPRPSPGALSAAADTLRSIPTGHDVVVDGVLGPKSIAAAQSAYLQAPEHLSDAYGIARRNYYFRIADRRKASRKYARTRAGGKGGWIRRAEEFISKRYHLTDRQFQERVSEWA